MELFLIFLLILGLYILFKIAIFILKWSLVIFGIFLVLISIPFAIFMMGVIFGNAFF